MTVGELLAALAPFPRDALVWLDGTVGPVGRAVREDWITEAGSATVELSANAAVRVA